MLAGQVVLVGVSCVLEAGVRREVDLAPVAAPVSDSPIALPTPAAEPTAAKIARPMPLAAPTPLARPAWTRGAGCSGWCPISRSRGRLG